MKAHLKSLVKPTESTTATTPSHVKALEPRPYIGERDIMVIENFLSDLRHHVDTNTTSKVDKVFLTSLYLTGHAKT